MSMMVLKFGLKGFLRIVDLLEYLILESAKQEESSAYRWNFDLITDK